MRINARLIVLAVMLSIVGAAVATAQLTSPYPWDGYPPPPPPPCTITDVGAYFWGAWNYQSGWMDYSCEPGYTGKLEIKLHLQQYVGNSTLVSGTTYAHVSDFWPKSYRNPDCTFDPYGRVVGCPIGEEPYLYEYAPSSGGLDTSAYGAMCYRAVAYLRWERSYNDHGYDSYATAWTGACY